MVIFIYQVYIAELDCDPNLCTTRNIHNRSESEINALFKGWEPTPSHYLKMDLRNFLQGKEIDHVEMEDADDDDYTPTAGEPEKEVKDRGSVMIEEDNVQYRGGDDVREEYESFHSGMMDRRHY